MSFIHTYKLDELKQVVLVEDLEEWCVELQLQAEDKRWKVEDTTIERGGRKWLICTDFLGIDHGWPNNPEHPLIFESMIFAEDDPAINQSMMRYRTWREAKAGHAEMVVRALSGALAIL